MRLLLRPNLIAVFRLLGLLTLAVPNAFAQPSAAFVSTWQPRQSQDSVARVWVNLKSHVYHCAGSQYYGNTKSGEYLLEPEAREQGNRPAYGRTCGPLPTKRVPLSTALPASRKVWLNTSSGVYHCPGSRYYGNTKHGRFMTESEARAQAYRPAYGKPVVEQSPHNNRMQLTGRGHRFVWRLALPSAHLHAIANSPRPCS